MNTQSIGWCHYYVCFRMLLLYLPTSRGDTRDSIANLWFCKYIIYWHIWDLFLDNADIFLVCHHPHILYGTDWLQSIYCQLNKGTSDSHHINELLWVIGSFSKTYPSFLPLIKAPPLISVFFNSLYAPFGSPCRG